MQLRNDDDRYGFVSVFVHWVMAAAIIGLFVLGLWMTGLSYYDPWYRQGPALHKSIGILVLAALVFRAAWRMASPPPPPLATHGAFERRIAILAHLLLYLLLVLVIASGYLISTADGRSVEVFGLFTIPATITSIPGQEDIAGTVHLALAIVLMVLVALHAAGALKHHFIDRDRTMPRILGRAIPDTSTPRSSR